MMPKTHHVFGPAKPSRLALMGVRFADGPDGAPPAEPAAKPEPPKPSPPAQDPTDWKAEARKWEERAKENKGAAEKLAEIEEANKTELQKATERAEKAERDLADRSKADEERKLREQVAEAKKVPASLLTGTTKDELEASANELLAFRGEQQKPADKASYIIPDEGGQPSIGKPASPRAGIGTLRDAYEEIERK